LNFEKVLLFLFGRFFWYLLVLHFVVIAAIARTNSQLGLDNPNLKEQQLKQQELKDHQKYDSP